MITLLILATMPWSQVEITAVVINAIAAGVGEDVIQECFLTGFMG